MLRFDHRTVEDIFATFKRQVPAPMGCSWTLHHERGTDEGTVYTLSAQDHNGLGPTGVDLQTTWTGSRTAYDALQAMIQVSRYLHQRALENQGPERQAQATGPTTRTFSTLLNKTEAQWTGKRFRSYEIDVERSKPSRADFTTTSKPTVEPPKQHGLLRRRQIVPGRPATEAQQSERSQRHPVVIRKKPRLQTEPDPR